MRRGLPANQLGTGAIGPDTEAWLRSRGAVFAHIDADGVIEFSTRPIGDALTDAAAGLLGRRTGLRRTELAPVAQ